LSQFNYFGPRNFGVFASYYTETLLYSNFRGPLFSRTCQAREIRKTKGMRKNGFYSMTRFVWLKDRWGGVRAQWNVKHSIVTYLTIMWEWSIWNSQFCHMVLYCTVLHHQGWP